MPPANDDVRIEMNLPSHNIDVEAERMKQRKLRNGFLMKVIGGLLLIAGIAGAAIGLYLFMKKKDGKDGKNDGKTTPRTSSTTDASQPRNKPRSQTEEEPASPKLPPSPSPPTLFNGDWITVTYKVTGEPGPGKSLLFNWNETVGDLRRTISWKMVGHEFDDRMIVFGGKPLMNNAMTLRQCGFKKKSTLYLTV